MSDKLGLVMSELKRLSNGKVTKVSLPDDALLSSYEAETGIEFSEDYKRFLKAVSNVFFGTIDPLTVTRDRAFRGELANALEDARRLGVPSEWVPICEDNGDYYCLTPSGQVRFWSLDGPTDESWPDLATWIEKVWIGEA
jgi:hypothetical protein